MKRNYLKLIFLSCCMLLPSVGQAHGPFPGPAMGFNSQEELDNFVYDELVAFLSLQAAARDPKVILHEICIRLEDTKYSHLCMHLHQLKHLKGLAAVQKLKEIKKHLSSQLRARLERNDEVRKLEAYHIGYLKALEKKFSRWQ